MKIGILGGGQLGYMFIQNALAYPVSIGVLDPSSDCSCATIADEFTQGDFNNYDDVMAFGRQYDVVSIEIEHVCVEALEDLEKEGIQVIPSPAVLAIIIDKGIQKEYYSKHDIPTAPFILIEGKKDEAIKNMSFPCFQKLRTGGYDGKGVVHVESPEHLLDVPSVLEQPANLAKELAVLVVINHSGQVATYPVVEQVFDENLNLLDYLLCPADIPKDLAIEAQSLAKKVALSFNSPGVFAVELFLNKNGVLWVNEIAPRVHNSGHATIEGNVCSQFDQMYRVLTNQNLGDAANRFPNAIVNLVGEDNHQGSAQLVGTETIFGKSSVYLHWYQKKITKPGRKMGHITITNTDITQLKRDIADIKDQVKIISK